MIMTQNCQITIYFIHFLQFTFFLDRHTRTLNFIYCYRIVRIVIDQHKKKYDIFVCLWANNIKSAFISCTKKMANSLVICDKYSFNPMVWDVFEFCVCIGWADVQRQMAWRAAAYLQKQYDCNLSNDKPTKSNNS